MYHEGSRKLQEKFGSTALADRLVDKLHHNRFTDSDRKFIESLNCFFLSTADDKASPDCSYKGGDTGFVRVLADDLLVFPSFDGNGMYKSLGNIAVNPQLGLLFIEFDSPRRLRVNGTAELSDDRRYLDLYDAAELVVLVQPVDIFPNCPRYIHPASQRKLSDAVPRAGHEPPVPEWKLRDAFNDVLPVTDPARRDAGKDG